jgi:beta-glucosidase
MAQIDAAVRRVLELKAHLGLLDDPYRRSNAASALAARGEPPRQLAREAACRSIVLLTNRDGVLPLRGQPRRLAVIGPLADARDDMQGPWAAAGRAEGMVTILEGLRAALPDSEIRFVRGVEIEAEAPSDIAGALDLARSAEVVLLCLGEARRMSGEAASRARPDLPGRQVELAQAVLGVGKPVVALLSSGRPLMASWLFERAHAVLATWFLGSEAGHAIGDVLSGRWNPTGRLPVSWPVEVGQIPIFYARPPTGRPPDPAVHYSSKYLDLPVEPLFPFGHGLSYTRFGLSGLRASPSELRSGETIAIECDVLNEGPVAGEETVLLFVRDPVASLARPLLELKGMAKIALEPGRGGTVRFTLAAQDLSFLGPDLRPRLEPGVFELAVGRSAAHAQLLRTSVRLLER